MHEPISSMFKFKLRKNNLNHAIDLANQVISHLKPGKSNLLHRLVSCSTAREALTGTDLEQNLKNPEWTGSREELLNSNFILLVLDRARRLHPIHYDKLIMKYKLDELITKLRTRRMGISGGYGDDEPPIISVIAFAIFFGILFSPLIVYCVIGLLCVLISNQVDQLVKTPEQIENSSDQTDIKMWQWPVTITVSMVLLLKYGASNLVKIIRQNLGADTEEELHLMPLEVVPPGGPTVIPKNPIKRTAESIAFLVINPKGPHMIATESRIFSRRGQIGGRGRERLGIAAGACAVVFSAILPR